MHSQTIEFNPETKKKQKAMTRRMKQDEKNKNQVARPPRFLSQTLQATFSRLILTKFLFIPPLHLRTSLT